MKQDIINAMIFYWRIYNFLLSNQIGEEKILMAGNAYVQLDKRNQRDHGNSQGGNFEVRAWGRKRFENSFLFSYIAE